MGRQDFFEVWLQTPSLQNLPVVEHDQQRWFVGEPGAEFIVRVNAVLYSGHPYRLTLQVDGQDPGYAMIVFGNTHGTHTKTDFPGWMCASTGGSTATYKAFKLGKCQPSQTAATVSNPDDLKAGRVEVKIEKVASSGTTNMKPIIKEAGPSSAANKKLQEGKKWFLAPGLKAEAGSASVKPVTWTTVVYRTVATLPSLKVRYDSSEALYLRKALNPRFAPHRPILRQSANPSIASMGAEPAAAAGAAGSSRQSASAAARVKREAGVAVKRERDVHGGDQDDDDFVVPRSATAAVDVDLTEEPLVPLSVNGRQLAPDELAVCDLCDSDDDGEGPKWEVRKKQHIEVEL